MKEMKEIPPSHICSRCAGTMLLLDDRDEINIILEDLGVSIPLKEILSCHCDKKHPISFKTKKAPHPNLDQQDGYWDGYSWYEMAKYKKDH